MDGCSWPKFYFPPTCKGVDIVIGVDEAGRGPVLGPLVYAAAFWPVSEHQAISSLGFNDSKQLKEHEREALFDKIRSHPSVGWVIEELSAQKLSEEMLRVNPVSLNTISYSAVIKILQMIADGGGQGVSGDSPQVTEIFIDTVGDPSFYKSQLVRALGEEFGKFTIEKKADATYKVVSAASIVAKVTRDKITSCWVWKEPGLSWPKTYGSGYPSDEHCVKWLDSSQNHIFGYPNFVRFSWSTTKEALVRGSACKIDWECDEEENTGGADIKNYFAAAGSKEKTKRMRRSSYFTQRKMKHFYREDIINLK
eukprot:gene5185-7215_t